MPTPSDSDFRRVLRHLLLAEAVAAGAVALACWLLGGGYAALSALAGAATGVIANLYLMLRGLRPARPPYDAHSARRALGRMYRGQVVKYALTVALFIAAAQLPHLSWPAMLASYGAILAVFWWVSVAWAQRQSQAPGHGPV